MTSPFRPWLAVVLAVLMLVGCAGRDFTRAAPETLQLGKTTYAEILARFGTPYREGTMLKNERTLTHVTYAYSVAGGTPLHEGVTPARAQAFYFADLVLVGHDFSSSFKDDHTDFPEARVADIRKGETKESALLELMGPPGGVYLFPLVGKDEKGLVYTYSQTRVEPIPFAPKIRHYQKEAIVSVGADGTVTNVQFNASGER